MVIRNRNTYIHPQSIHQHPGLFVDDLFESRRLLESIVELREDASRRPRDELASAGQTPYKRGHIHRSKHVEQDRANEEDPSLSS